MLYLIYKNASLFPEPHHSSLQPHVKHSISMSLLISYLRRDTQREKHKNKREASSNLDELMFYELKSYTRINGMAY